MKLRIHFISICISTILLSTAAFCQTQNDTMYTYKTQTNIAIDGSANEAAWANAEWFTIDQVWIPYEATMAEGDFAGRFKLCWDADYLYLLAEIIDDSLSDDYTDPLSDWWKDDCLEVFIDEDRSKGNHERNNNAFAYHVSLTYDAIDLSPSGPINYKDHIEVIRTTTGTDTSLWEMAIKLYDETYSSGDPEASRVTPEANKIMGFTLAYCDNDETAERENFIGSMFMTSSTANDNYITADYFGTLQLIDPEFVPQAEIIVSELSGNTSETGGSASFIVELNNAIDSNVVVNLSSSNIMEGTISPEELTFTPDNYSEPQTVTITGIDDDEPDGDIDYTIILSVNEGSDSDYRNLSDTEIEVINIDDEEAVSALTKTLQTLRISPNPAKEQLIICNCKLDYVQYEIISLSGVVIKSGQLNNEASAIDIERLESGSYLLVLRGAKEVLTKRFIKL